MNLEEKQIEEQIGIANDLINDGESKYPSMTYEEGVKYALEWILFASEPPLPDGEI